ncbi:MAG: 2-oxoacid:ferredoxin oxidoreductase subunit beta [Rhodothermaceae bacterium]|nr:2-oxoacid:ferredoxin oxidoreductase subunit beta [Rhodothermaceae bacterium]
MSDDQKPKGVKPAGLPTGAKPAGPPKAAKPAGPPKAAKPAGPPGAKAVKPPARPALRPPKPPTARVVGAPAEGDGEAHGLPVLTRKDFATPADVRWCPGCGDYAVLAAVQRVLPELTEKKEDVVFISGIGCSSRFPYYMNTYGMHSIHGRAPTVATGLKSSRPELDVWVITGDGDALSIGAGHFAHMLRRNVDLQVILFNNQIYGLTKGQYSPTSEVGKVTKSSPYGSLDHPFNPAALALGADASFVARTMDRDPKHMQAMLRRAHAHRGTAFVEVYQNCNIFNDGAFFDFTEKDSKPERTVFVEHGQPLVYDDGTKGIMLDGVTLRSVNLDDGNRSTDDCLVWDEGDKTLAFLVIQQLFWNDALPRPFGVFYIEDRPAYDAMLQEQVEAVTEKKGEGDLRALLHAGATWTIS